MPTSLERPAAPTGPAFEPGHWSQIPRPPERRVRSALVSRLLRLAVVVGIAVVLWALGRHGAAVVIVTIALVATFVPPVAMVVERVTGAIQVFVSRVLTFALIGFVEVVLFSPVAVVAGVTRRDPLGRGSKPTDPTFWEQHPGADRRSLHRRQFTYDRPKVADGQVGGHRYPLWRVRGALGLLVVLFLVDFAVGAGIDAIERIDNASSTGGVAASDAAFADEPWGPELVLELRAVFEGRVDNGLGGFVMPDYDGRYVHVKDAARRSYQPASTGQPGSQGRPLRVVFFGGSTMFGVYQRDEHTIPSEFARLAEADGIDIEVVNYGQQAYTIWQEAQLFHRLFTGGMQADLVVFYDGANEMISQITRGPSEEPVVLAGPPVAPPEEPLAQRMREFWAARSAAARGYDAIKSMLNGKELMTGEPVQFWGEQPVDKADEAAANAVSVHRRGVSAVEALAEKVDVPVAFFWQPTLYSKKPLAAERSAFGNWGENPDLWDPLVNEARKLIEAPVIDVTDALDGAKKPVMVDFHHTNEAGARLVASALYRDLRTQLVDLDRQS
jgi:hypothetical protein